MANREDRENIIKELGYKYVVEENEEREKYTFIDNDGLTFMLSYSKNGFSDTTNDSVITIFENKNKKIILSDSIMFETIRNLISYKMDNFFVPYGIAVKLKEIEFDEPCLKYYHTDKTLRSISEGWYNETCSAPLYDQVIDWFLDKHQIAIDICLDDCISKKWEYTLYTLYDDDYLDNDLLFNNRYEALNEGILEAIELIKQEK